VFAHSHTQMFAPVCRTLLATAVSSLSPFRDNRQFISNHGAIAHHLTFHHSHPPPSPYAISTGLESCLASRQVPGIKSRTRDRLPLLHSSSVAPDKSRNSISKHCFRTLKNSSFTIHPNRHAHIVPVTWVLFLSQNYQCHFRSESGRSAEHIETVN
jgi:hypothetical protein